MNNIVLNGENFEVIIEVNAENKLERLSKSKEDVIRVLERNTEQIENIGSEEDFMIKGEFVIIGYKENSKIAVTSVISNANVF